MSGGERQRIAIARALVRDPAILILDEATSSVDVESERRIHEGIRRLGRGRTTFVIAHRASALQQVDRVIVLEQGRLLEAGAERTFLAGHAPALPHPGWPGAAASEPA